MRCAGWQQRVPPCLHLRRVAPKPSCVVAFIPTRVSCIPRACAIISRICGYVGGDFRGFGDQCHVHIDNGEPGLCHTGRNITEKLILLISVISRVGIGVKIADIRQARRAEQGITQGMEQDIGIGMAVQSAAFGVGDVNTAQHQPAARRQAVDIIPKADPCFAGHCTLPRAEYRLRQGQVFWRASL